MIAAWIGALLVGLSLGLLGSGGSILTVPILIYLVGEPKKVAIAESLGIVGTIAFAGFIPYAIQKKCTGEVSSSLDYRVWPDPIWELLHQTISQLPSNY